MTDITHGKRESKNAKHIQQEFSPFSSQRKTKLKKKNINGPNEGNFKNKTKESFYDLLNLLIININS